MNLEEIKEYLQKKYVYAVACFEHSIAKKEKEEFWKTRLEYTECLLKIFFNIEVRHDRAKRNILFIEKMISTMSYEGQFLDQLYL